jgi:hypothetical protein
MPRQARIDAPGALHHIIARGIGRKKIFNIAVIEKILSWRHSGFNDTAVPPSGPTTTKALMYPDFPIMGLPV